MGSSRNKGGLFRNSTLPEVFDEHSIAFYSSATPAPSGYRCASLCLHRVEQGSGKYTETWLCCPVSLLSTAPLLLGLPLTDFMALVPSFKTL